MFCVILLMYKQALRNQEPDTLSTPPSKQPWRHKRQTSRWAASLPVICTAGQAGRQASIMFWAVIADCSPLLPVSGLAIVAEAKWMGSEPEMMPTTRSASNKGLECIHHRQNKHLQQKCSHVWAGTQPHRHNKMTVNTAKCVSLRAHRHRQTSEKLKGKQTIWSLFFLTVHPSFCIKVAGSGAGLSPCQSGQH